jgi:hypothetical protein
LALTLALELGGSERLSVGLTGSVELEASLARVGGFVSPRGGRFAEVREDFEERASVEEPLAALAASALSLLGLTPTPTASLKRVYKLLNPCWTMSPAEPAFSEVGAAEGGGAKSLNVVKESLPLAELWM